MTDRREMPKRLAEMDAFPIIQIPDDAAENPETTGTKSKFWYRGMDGASYLFKESREGTGEHWSEKIAYELALLMGIPCAAYDLACWKGKNGVVSKSVLSDTSERLVLGNEMLFAHDQNYRKDGAYKNRYYTVKLVMYYLKNIPIYCFYKKSDVNEIEFTKEYVNNVLLPRASFVRRAFLSILGVKTKMADVFIGYLLLDAWIGNTDRHHENWTYIFSKLGVTLAPTYDHASCLGRELMQDKKAALLSGTMRGQSVAAYCSKAKAALYREMEDKKPLSPVEAFLEAGAVRKKAASLWLEKLEDIPDAWIDRILELMPEGQMTKTDKDFAKSVLMRNKETIRRQIKDLKWFL